MYVIEYENNWDMHFLTFDLDIQKKISKKIAKLTSLESVRHLQFGIPLFVIEVGQYRICFRQTDSVRKIIFVGNHKQYEKWYSSVE